MSEVTQFKFYLRPSNFQNRIDITQYVLREFEQKWSTGITDDDYRGRISEIGTCTLRVDNKTGVFNVGHEYNEGALSAIFTENVDWYLFIEVNPIDAARKWVFIGKLQTIYSEPRSRADDDSDISKLEFYDKMWDLYNSKQPIKNRDGNFHPLLTASELCFTSAQAIKRSVPKCNADDIYTELMTPMCRDYITSERKFAAKASEEVTNIMNSEFGLLFPDYSFGLFDRMRAIGRLVYYNQNAPVHIITVEDNVYRIKYNKPLVKTVFAKSEQYSILRTALENTTIRLDSGVEILDATDFPKTVLVDPSKLPNSQFIPTNRNLLNGKELVCTLHNPTQENLSLITVWGSGHELENGWPSKLVNDIANYEETMVSHDSLIDTDHYLLLIDTHAIFFRVKNLNYLRERPGLYPVRITLVDLNFDFVVKTAYDNNPDEFDETEIFKAPYLQNDVPADRPTEVTKLIEDLWRKEYIHKYVFSPNAVKEKHVPTLGSYMRINADYAQENHILVGQKYKLANNALEITNYAHPYKDEAKPQYTQEPRPGYGEFERMYLSVQGGDRRIYVIDKNSNRIQAEEFTIHANPFRGTSERSRNRINGLAYYNNRLYLIGGSPTLNNSRRIGINVVVYNINGTRDASKDSPAPLTGGSIFGIAINNDRIYIATNTTLNSYDHNWNRHNNERFTFRDSLDGNRQVSINDVAIATEGIYCISNSVNRVYLFSFDGNMTLRFSILNSSWSGIAINNDIAYCIDQLERCYAYDRNVGTRLPAEDLVLPAISDRGSYYIAADIKRSSAPTIINLLPRLVLKADNTLIRETTTINLQAIAEDPDGNIVSYLWESETGFFGTPNAANTTWRSPNVEENPPITPITLSCKVTDNDGAEVIRHIVIRVHDSLYGREFSDEFSREFN